jgi:hypothetical protein
MSKPSEDSSKPTELKKMYTELKEASQLNGLYRELRSLKQVLERKGVLSKQLLKVMCECALDDVWSQRQRDHATPEPRLAKPRAKEESPSYRSLKALRSPAKTVKVLQSPKALNTSARLTKQLDRPRLAQLDFDSVYSEFSHAKEGGVFSRAKRQTFETKDVSPGPAAYHQSKDPLFPAPPGAVINRSIASRLNISLSPSPGPAYYSPRTCYLSRF